MSFLDRYREDEADILARQIAVALKERLGNADGQIVVIAKLDIQVNYCSGGGAKLHVSN